MSVASIITQEPKQIEQAEDLLDQYNNARILLFCVRNQWTSTYPPMQYDLQCLVLWKDAAGCLTRKWNHHNCTLSNRIASLVAIPMIESLT
jgi:hypothetical protein